MTGAYTGHLGQFFFSKECNMPRKADANKRAPYAAETREDFDDIDNNDLDDRMDAQQAIAGNGRTSGIALSSDDAAFN